MDHIPQMDHLPQNNISKESNKMQKVVVVIPAFNESNNIIQIIKDTKKYASEVIVVDDGSTDNTLQKALSTDAKVLRNRRNCGKGVALKKGLIESINYDPDIIVTIDADGQHDPHDIPNLLEPIQNGSADMVIGSRYITKKINEVPLVRRVGLSIINMLNHSLENTTVKDTQSGFRAYSKSVIKVITNSDSRGYGAENEQLAEAETHGFSIVEVPVNIKYGGLENTSKKHPFFHGTHLVSIILKIAIEKRPLLFFGLGGVILIIISLLPMIKMLIIFNETRYFSIPLFLISMGLIFIGILLIMISFILYALNRIKRKLDR